MHSPLRFWRDDSGARTFCRGWPAGFLAGNGTGRLYFDTDVSQEQRSALESIFGQKGGIFEILAGLIPDVLPTKEVPINIQPGEDATRIKVGDVGGLMVAPLRDEEGNLRTLRHAPIRFVEDTVLARGTGSSWRDPEMRQWESGGHAEQGDFDWSG